MPVRRDPRTNRWFFRTTVQGPSGRRQRVFGTPGIPGPYQDLAQTKVGAQEAERRAIAAVMSGEAMQVQTQRKEVPTVAKYAETFLELYAATHKPSVQREKKRILENMLIPHFGRMRLDEIRQSDVDRFVVACAGKSPKTINNRLAVLSTLLRYAARNHLIAKPELRFTIPTESSELVAVPMADVDKLVALAPPVLRAAVLLAAEAGLRAGEIRGLQWGDVKDGEIRVRRALDTDTGEAIPPKHNKHRTVPISERLASELDSLPRRGLWVLTTDEGRPLGHRIDLYKPLVRLYDAAEVPRPPSPVHCLRHTFGSECAAKGVPLAVLKELMGHSSIQTTMRYIHVNAAQKTQAIKAAFGSGGSAAAAVKRKTP